MSQFPQYSNVTAAERYVLGSVVILAGPPPLCGEAPRAAVGELYAMLGAEDFDTEIHGKLWQSMQDLLARGAPVDPLTVAYSVGDKMLSADLLDMAAEVPTALNAPWYGRIVVDAAIKRRVARVAIEMVAGADAQEADALVAEVQGKLAEIGKRRRVGAIEAVGDLAHRVMDLVESRTSVGGVTGVRSSIPRLDEVTGGFQPEDLVILAARTSMGKTALAGQMAVNAAISGVPVFFVTLEMSTQQLMERFLAYVARVDHEAIRTGAVQSHWPALHGAGAKLRGIPLQVFSSGRKQGEIAAAAMRWRATHPDGLGLIVVDYLQLVELGRRADSREQAVAEISRGLKALARELQVPVVALAQLGRAVENENRDPKLSDLRESGSLEQDADVVLFVQRNREEKEGIAKITVAKNRSGRVGTVEARWVGRFLAFEPPSDWNARHYTDERE